MKLANIIKRIRRKIPFTRKKMKGLLDLVNDPKLSRTYFPEEDRKSKASIWWDNFLWLAKFGEVNRYYYVYGLDRKKESKSNEILSYKDFYRKRNSRNLHPTKEGYNYVCILRDKFVFSQFLASLGFPAPKNVALLNADQITWLSDMKSMPIGSLAKDRQNNINGFCKKLTGILGEGAFPLKISDGKLYIKEKEITIDQLKESLSGEYLLQERIIQHPRMGELHSHSVNTIRMISFNNYGKVEIFSAALRIGTKGRSVDNWASGGIVVGVDLETGRLQKEGIFKPGYGGRVEKHSDTGIILKDFEIPFFRESVRLTCDLHRYLYGIHSIGWDIAITENGPVFIEGNDDWEGGIPMSLERNFKSRFMKMYDKAEGL